MRQKIGDLEKKITDHNHDKYITTSKSNTLAARVFNKISKSKFNKTKHLLVENELKKLKTFDSSYFIGKRWCTKSFSISANVYIF